MNKKNMLFLDLLGAWSPALAASASESLEQGPVSGQVVVNAADAESVKSVSDSKDKKKLGDFVKMASPTIKFGGYITAKYSINDRSGESSNGGFDLRYLRLYANGYCFNDFYYRFQLEACGAPGIDKGARVLDAFVEWQKYDFLKIKMGQFKRPFVSKTHIIH